MASWTTPKTWATGDVLTAADMNIYVRDNSQYLYDRFVARVHRTAVQSISDNTNTFLNFTAERTDVGSWHDNATNNDRLTVPSGASAGADFIVGACVDWASSAAGRRELWIELFQSSGSSDGIIAKDVRAPEGGGACTQCVVTQITLVNQNYFFRCGVYQNSGGALNVQTLGGSLAEASPTFWAMQVGR